MLMTMILNVMKRIMIELLTMMLKAEDSIQIPADTISGLYCSLYWEMTKIMNFEVEEDVLFSWMTITI